MYEQLIHNIKGLLIKPGDTFERLKNSSLTDSYQHYVILLIFYSVLMGIFSVISILMYFYDFLMYCASIPLLGSFFVLKIELLKPILINWSLSVVYLLFLVMFFGIFLKGCFLHVFVILFGGNHGITKTLQVVMYAATPFFLLGWIPYISLIGIVWSIILCIIGLQIIQSVPGWKAVAIILIPFIFMTIWIFAVLMMRVNFITALSGII